MVAEGSRSVYQSMSAADRGDILKSAGIFVSIPLAKSVQFYRIDGIIRL